MKDYIYILFVKMIWQLESDKFDLTTTSLTFVIIYVIIAAVAHHSSSILGEYEYGTILILYIYI